MYCDCPMPTASRPAFTALTAAALVAGSSMRFWKSVRFASGRYHVAVREELVTDDKGRCRGRLIQLQEGQRHTVAAVVRQQRELLQLRHVRHKPPRQARIVCEGIAIVRRLVERP